MLLAKGDKGKRALAQGAHGFEAESTINNLTIDDNQNRKVSKGSSSQGPEYLEIVARATNDAIRDWDVKTGALSWPQGLEGLLGYAYPPAKTINFWQEQVHPEDRARVTEDISVALASNGDNWSGEYRLRGADGNYLYMLERALIERDANGQAVRFVGSLMDITARKQLRDQLCRSQRMEAFGQLAGGLAHDFNNFLTTILGYSDLVMTEPGVKGVAVNHIAEIRKAASRASDLAGQLLTFSRKRALAPQVVEVNALITNLERSLLPLLGENISVACHFHHEKEGAHIRVDPSQVTQIVLNLAVNSRDAMPKGGRLTLETGIVDLTVENHPLFVGGEFVPGEYVIIRISDTGAGMSDDVKAHLFEPFFTTKEDRSGLGLATSYGIVRQSGGYIRIESEQGKGTTAEIYFPKVAPPPIPSYKKPSLKKLPGGNETVLVLEDDISVRHISVRVLRKLGYQVIEAANGDDAQQLISERTGHDIDLLLTDMVMPQMSGRRFADWLKKISPNTKVVFVSGYLTDSLQPGERIDDGMFFLPKPFDPEQLATTIRQALDS